MEGLTWDAIRGIKEEWDRSREYCDVINRVFDSRRNDTRLMKGLGFPFTRAVFFVYAHKECGMRTSCEW